MIEIRKFVMIYSLTSLIGLAAFTIPALAEGTDPCAADVQKFCSDIQPGNGRIVACLKAHENDLSGACKQQGEALKQKVQSFMAACQEDSDKYCKDVQPGAGRKIQCLKDNVASLSPDCKAQVTHIQNGVRIQPSGTPSQPPPAPSGSH